MTLRKTNFPIGFTWLCVLLCVALLLPRAGSSQSTFGDIRGTIHDPGSLPVPQAEVTLRDMDENTERTTITDDSGGYLFQNLKPGHYSLSANKTGFSRSTTVELELTARQSARADVTLSIQQVMETVTVESAAEQINTENAEVGDTRGNDQLVEMPINSRAQTTSPLASLTLSPNIVTDSQGNIAVGGATFAQTGFSVDGISTANVAANGSLQNAYPSSEGIGELKVTAFDNSAEFAQVADVTFVTKSGTNNFHGSLFEYLQNDVLDANILNFPTKAPKRFNTFGGSVGGPVTIPHVYHGKDKTFFFFDYEGNRRETSVPEQYLVPTQDERNGDLNLLIQQAQANPQNPYAFVTPLSEGSPSQPTNVLMNPFTGMPFTNATIPQGMISKVSQNLLNLYYPLPNVNINVLNPAYNYQTLQPTPSNTNGWDLRLDHNITTNQQIYARFSWKNLLSDVGQGSTPVNPLLPNDVDTEHDRSLVVSYNYTITPRIINEFRFGFTNSLINQAFPIQGAAADNQLGLTGISFANHPTTGAFPTFNFSDGSGFTQIGQDKDGPGASKTLEFTDNLTRIIGKHSIRVGLDVRRVFYETVVRWGQSDDFGAFTFNQGVFTGSAFGDFLLGLPNTSFIVGSSPNTNESSVHWGTYAEDTWQATSRLTVNFGLRWEVNPTMSEESGDIANFLPINGGEVVVPDQLLKTISGNPLLQTNYNNFLISFNACQLATRNTALPCSNVLTASQAGLPPSLEYTYWHDFDPRISIAFRPFRDNKTVFRAGFGIFTDTMLGPLAYTTIGIPLGDPYTYTNANSLGQPQFQFPNASPANQALQYGGSGFYDAMNPHFRDPQTAQWSVTLEHEFGSDTAVRISYAGMNSYRLNVTEDYNAIPPSTQAYVPSPYVDPRAPYQNWLELYVSQNAGFANYQALTLDVTHRLSHGLSFQGNYTWAKDLSDAQGDAPGGFIPEVLLFTPSADQFDLRLGRGNVAGMPRQRFLLTGTYELPFGPGKFLNSKNKFVNGVVGGWSVNTITLIQSGQWFTPVISPTEDQSNTDIVGRGGITLRPDEISNPNIQSPGLQWNGAAFVPTPAGQGRIGNAGVGILEGPGMINVNAGLARRFKIKEGLNLRFEATFTNVLNHTNFAPPATDVSDSSTFGALTSAQPQSNGGNRTGQLALRLDF
jgi:Carboxypeptidase regulatory-like domain